MIDTDVKEKGKCGREAEVGRKLAMLNVFSGSAVNTHTVSPVVSCHCDSLMQCVE